VPDLPAAARLVVWGNAVLGGGVSPDEAADRVTGPADAAHRMVGLPGEDGAVSLPYAFARLSALGVTSLRLVLPRPGDALGLPGPPAFNERAVAAGAAVLTRGHLALGLLGELRGSWTAHRVDHDSRPAMPLTDAEKDLRRVVRTAAARLAHLDVARWHPAAADVLAHPAANGSGPLPRSLAPTARLVMDTSLRLLSVVDVARRDDGAAVSATEMAERREVLREIDVVARRALEAACGAAAP
jgi:hypothetical protein